MQIDVYIFKKSTLFGAVYLSAKHIFCKKKISVVGFSVHGMVLYTWLPIVAWYRSILVCGLYFLLFSFCLHKSAYSSVFVE